MKTASQARFYRDAKSEKGSNSLRDLQAIALWAALGLAPSALFTAYGADVAPYLGMAG